MEYVFSHTEAFLRTHERLLVRAVILAQLLAIVLPFLLLFWFTPAGQVWGGLLYKIDDQNVNLAWARQAAGGAFFFRNLFSTESLVLNTRPLFTNLYCWAMGVLSVALRVPLIAVYHGLRLLFAALTLLWFYKLCRALTPSRTICMVALLLAAFTSGDGWLAAIAPALGRSVDFVDRPESTLLMPEAFTFTSAMLSSLFIASTALLCAVYLLVLRAQREHCPGYAWLAAAATLLLGNIHTYDVLPLLVTLAIWAGCSPRRGLALIAALGALPPLLYQLVVFESSPEFRLKALVKTPAPNPLDLALSYGPLLLLALVGVWQARRRDDLEPGWQLVALWPAVTLLAIYAPVSFARKMIEGVHLPLCFLAAYGLVWLLGTLPHRAAARALGLAFLLLMAASPWHFTTWCLRNAAADRFANFGMVRAPVYLTAGEAGALRFLRSVPPAQRRGAVLCMPQVGDYVPRESGCVVYVGHWAETLDPALKMAQAVAFFGANMPPARARQLLARNRIGYVLEGSFERHLMQLAHSRSEARALGLPVLFHHDETTLYGVPAP